MKKRIVVDDLVKRELSMMFKVSMKCVWEALNYRTKEGISKAIRAAAMQRGGQKVPTVVSCQAQDVDVVTYFDTVGEKMIQLLEGGRGKIIVSLTTNSAIIELDGERYGEVESLMPSDLPVWHSKIRGVINQLNS